MSALNPDARPTPSGISAPEPRVAVLEEITAATKQTLIEIRDDIRSLRGEVREGIYDLRRELRGEIRDSRVEMDRRFDWLDSEIGRNSRRLLGVMFGGFAVMLTVMAHGFHWL